MEETTTYTAFVGHQRLVSADLRTMLLRTKEHLGASRDPAVLLVFEDKTGRQVDFDMSGSEAEILARVAPPPAGPGRPKLGVVSREVSLLPRHWEWLEQQPQGLSGTLRRLIDEARKRAPGAEEARLARDAASKVMWSIAGDLPDFEEASRALFAGDRPRFEALIKDWPADVREYVQGLAAPSFVPSSS